MDPQTRYRLAHERLNAAYGEPHWRQQLPPVDELVSTILSQNTNDINRDRAFYALRDAYPDWEAVMSAPVDEVMELIRPAGLANQKAPRIQEALRTIAIREGRLSLDFLADMPLDEARQWLTGINGIGPKTAAIVLLFAFNRPAFPVDTHVHRITGRLGLIGPQVTAEQAHEVLAELGPPDTYYSFHLNLIRHGREVCRARQPLCERCPLQDICQYYAGLTA
jgi:endonuclease-3